MGIIENLGEWVGKQITRPFEQINTKLDAIQQENAEQTKRLNQIDKDTADLLCSQLTREHEFYLRQGWCSAADKRRLEDVYTRYKARGRNHIAENYISEIAKLREEP